MPPIAMLEDDGNVIDEFTTMCLLSNPHWNGREALLTAKGSSLQAGNIQHKVNFLNGF